MIVLSDYTYMSERDKRIVDAFCAAHPSPMDYIDKDFWEELLRIQYGKSRPITFETLFGDEKQVEINGAALMELLTGGES